MKLLEVLAWVGAFVAGWQARWAWDWIRVRRAVWRVRRSVRDRFDDPRR